ncbi:MAG: type II toxin-antitoxin system PemK/MazF family toxin [Nitrospira sp.]|nr:type II toxin-antitoxin system PemK/MazF family toxin [Nitrospira sp.]MDH4242496.1 type II toxin-antitoxin system PemK/MazF family toxin [Nitrospira sp.]MDH4355307.1 type II toxin-antitoxin system PemK/MazF family toxin [Nitrospira sp.]MDH5317459.1 type II toxin-antitoxin system PemK/MazF family toxin [Nitrospira sp.]
MREEWLKQLEIRWVDLNPTRGAETRKKRPCVIVQGDLVNRESQTVIVAPLLPGHKTWPFAVNVTPSQDNGIDRERHVNVKQLRAVDVSRIENKQGILERKYLDPIKDAVRVVFDL